MSAVVVAKVPLRDLRDPEDTQDHRASLFAAIQQDMIWRWMGYTKAQKHIDRPEP